MFQYQGVNVKKFSLVVVFFIQYHFFLINFSSPHKLHSLLRHDDAALLF